MEKTGKKNLSHTDTYGMLNNMIKYLIPIGRFCDLRSLSKSHWRLKVKSINNSPCHRTAKVQYVVQLML